MNKTPIRKKREEQLLKHEAVVEAFSYGLLFILWMVLFGCVIEAIVNNRSGYLDFGGVLISWSFTFSKMTAWKWFVLQFLFAVPGMFFLLKAIESVKSYAEHRR